MLTIIGIILLTLIVPWAGAIGLIALFCFGASFFAVWAIAVGASLAISILVWVFVSVLAVIFA